MEKKYYTLASVRKTCKDVNSFWVIIVDNIAVYLTYLVANYTNIKPNTITIVSAIFGVSASILFFFFTPISLILGSILFEISFILDGMDGKLARLTNNVSHNGALHDKVRDKLVHLLCAIALTLGGYITSGNKIYLTLGLLYLTLSFINNILAYKFMELIKKRGTTKGIPSLDWLSSTTPFITMKNFKFLGKKCYPIPSAFEWFHVLFFISPLFNNVILGFIISNFLIVVSILFLTIHSARIKS